MTTQRWRGQLSLAQLTAAAALAVAGALALAGTAAAQPGEHWFDRCAPSFYPTQAPDPTPDHYTNGPGPFGVEYVAPAQPFPLDGDPFSRAALTIDSRQPASSLSRWMTNTTQIAAPGCLLDTSPAGLGIFVQAQLRTQGVANSAILAVSYWNAGLQPIGTTDGGRIGGTTDWTPVTLSGTVPQGTRYIRVEYRLFGPGKLWIGPELGVLTSHVTIPNVVPPSIAGVARAGERLTALLGAWGADGRFLEDASLVLRQTEWLRCDAGGGNCSVIPDAGGGWGGPFDGWQNGPDPPGTYTLRDRDVGSTIRVRVTVSTVYEGPDSATSAATAVVEGGGSRLAPDSDFEADPGALYSTNGPGTFSWAADAAHGGTHALKIVSATSDLSRWLSRPQAIAATPGASYDVSAWLKTLGPQASARLSVNFWTAGGVYVPATADAQPALAGTTDWTRAAVHVTAPPGAAFMRVELRLNGPGTLWADDLDVTR